VSRYARELIGALGGIDADNEYVIYTRDAIHDLSLPANFQMKATGLAPTNPLHDFGMAANLRRDLPSIFHVLHGWLPVVLPAGIPIVMTLHDVFAVTDPKFFAKRRPFDGLVRAYIKWLISRSLRRCQSVITDSHFSRGEIRRVFPATSTPMTVVHLAPPQDDSVQIEHAYVDRIGHPYVLYVGNFRSYKDVGTLIKAFALYLGAPEREVPLLVLAGSDSPELVRQLALEQGISDSVRVVSSPDDAALLDLYHGARLLVQPSLYEGFGLTPLEAMRSGVPVIVSDAECLVEVCGDAARVFPRRDVGALAREISAVLSDTGLQGSMRLAGRRHAARYSWTATARSTLEVYRALVDAEPTGPVAPNATTR
jgi:alpha-1,3-rhamnosyl/mannosyltransferase